MILTWVQPRGHGSKLHKCANKKGQRLERKPALQSWVDGTDGQEQCPTFASSSVSCCQQWVGMCSCDPLPWACYRTGLGNPPHCCVMARNLMFAYNTTTTAASTTTTGPVHLCNPRTLFHFLSKAMFPFNALAQNSSWFLNVFTTDSNCQQDFVTWKRLNVTTSSFTP